MKTEDIQNFCLQNSVIGRKILPRNTFPLPDLDIALEITKELIYT